MNVEHWLGAACKIDCDILNREQLWVWRAKSRVPPPVDAKCVHLLYKPSLSPVDPVGRLEYLNQELAKCQKPGQPHNLNPPPNGHIYLVITAADQDLAHA